MKKSVSKKVRIQVVDRSWSGNLTPPHCDAGSGAAGKIKAEHRRTNSAGNIEPRLLRSSGMRRDWRFEELIGQKENGGRSMLLMTSH
ncbi:hypothetical protein TSUD_153830 [Trifolium subterraneum]|uniref:Uncharacterized protein n=1 Tax=Trifolium subterraneum TaxID=3900 RepID=A0A2Z6NH10_TRISU|nr:hypothetical protein TSUD_153830 [Trifolium subterraneum]